MIGVTSGVALLLASAGIIIWDQYLFRQTLRNDLASLADIIADNSTGAVALDDPDTANKTLQSLKTKDRVASACVYRTNGTVLARYTRATPAAAECPTPATDEFLFTDTHLKITRPILLNDRPIGTLVLLYDLGEIDERMLLYGATVLAVMLASSFLAVLLSSRLRERIALPILNLANTTRAVSQTKDYRLRAEKLSEDELGALMDAFNEMLGTIQLKDVELEGARDHLERRVLERTEELRLSEERFRLAAEQVESYAIFMLDRDGHVSTWNSGAERIKGYSAEEIIGKHFSIFYPPEDRAKPEKAVRQAGAEGRFEDEGWRVRKDGSQRLRSRAPSVPIFVITAIEDRQKAVEALAQGAQDYLVKGQFDAHLLERAISRHVPIPMERDAGMVVESRNSDPNRLSPGKS